MNKPKLELDLKSMKLKEAEAKITVVLDLLAQKQRALNFESKNDVNESHALYYYNHLLQEAKTLIRTVND